MRTTRFVLLIASALLVGTELVSLSVLIQTLGHNQTQRTDTAMEKALQLMPRIADWARSHAPVPKEKITAPWIEPFDTLTVEDPRGTVVDESVRRRLENGELWALTRMAGSAVDVLGSVKTDQETLFFRLTGSFAGDTRVATDGTLIAQHALILFAALIAFGVAGLARESNSRETAPALRAYEEAMLRLRVRDDERVAVFEREKLKMTEVLRDRETMARAGELTAGIVHEVRNSLGVIATQSGFVAKSIDDRSIAAASAISEEVRVLQGAMNRFLDFIRFERVDDRPFELSRFVNRTAAREGENHSTVIKVEGTSVLVRGDEDLLERAIENVVRNARQAAGEHGTVTISFGADQSHAFVIVEDDGPGLMDVEKALRPFESARPGGLGLGLPLVLKILSLHNGTLDFVRPSTGIGTQAVCRWPKAGLS